MGELIRLPVDSRGVPKQPPPPGIRVDTERGGHWQRLTIYEGWVFHDWPVALADWTKPFKRPLIFEPSRATTALDLRAFDGAWVDYAIGAKPPDVDHWELGLTIPSEEQVRRLATLTDFAPGWFYGPPMPELRGFICCGVT